MKLFWKGHSLYQQESTVPLMEFDQPVRQAMWIERENLILVILKDTSGNLYALNPTGDSIWIGSALHKGIDFISLSDEVSGALVTDAYGSVFRINLKTGQLTYDHFEK